jgi:hypothetical protein
MLNHAAAGTVDCSLTYSSCVLAKMPVASSSSVGEREWRHVEYEYPAEAERAFQAQVDRMSRAFESGFTHFCDQTVGQQK